jgi:hypothetical protein
MKQHKNPNNPAQKPQQQPWQKPTAHPEHKPTNPQKKQHPGCGC